MRKSRIAMALLAVACCNTALACDCTRMLDGASAELVFVGTATSENHWLRKGDEPGGAYSEMARFTFKVSRVIKGQVTSPVVVDSFVHDCGFPFRRGQSYRVYAYSQTDYGIQWIADRCSKTAPISKPRPKSVQGLHSAVNT